jgi:Ser/Thr protein kinase RdoA (MazF antagonist)
LPSEDVADFLVLLNLLPFYHADVSLKRRLRNAFLSGYSKHRPLNMESLGLFEVKSLMKRMAHNPHLKQTSAKKIWHRRKSLLKSYRKYLERLLA